MTSTSTTSACVRAGLVAAVLLLTSCGTARRGVPLTGEHTLPTEEIALGQRVFAGFCNGCHPGGAAGVGLALNDKPLPGWFIRYQVRHGIGVMPGFGKEVISDRELDALVDYLVYLRGLELEPGRE